MRTVVTDAAAADLAAIEDYIAADNSERAASFIDELLDRCADLADRAASFPLVERFARQGIRRRPHGRYLIFYRIRGKQVEIIHILRGARDYERLLTDML